MLIRLRINATAQRGSSASKLNGLDWCLYNTLYKPTFPQASFTQTHTHTFIQSFYRCLSSNIYQSHSDHPDGCTEGNPGYSFLPKDTVFDLIVVDKFLILYAFITNGTCCVGARI